MGRGKQMLTRDSFVNVVRRADQAGIACVGAGTFPQSVIYVKLPRGAT